MLHIHFTDQYQHGLSRIHRLDPRTKLIGALAYILVAALLPPGAWAAYALLLVGALFAAAASGLGPTFALKRAFIALPFALAAITLPFTIPGQTLAAAGPISISTEGTIRFASIVVKSWLSVQVAIVLAATTQFPELLWGLRALRVPQPLVSIVSFMYRYSFVLADEALRLMRARAARSGAQAGQRSGGGLLWRGRVAGGMIGNLFLRAFERSERIYDAMAARGFRGEMIRLAPPALTGRDVTAALGWLSFVAAALLAGRLM